MTISYSEHMKRITEKKLLEGLVGYGLFPDKIPPFLSSVAFYRYCINQDNHPKSSNSNSNLFKQNHVSNYIKYQNIRNINIPRVLAIPEPISYFNLCYCLSKNWGKLVHYFEEKTINNNYKISRIHVRKIKEKKYIFKISGNYNSHKFVKKAVKKPISKIFKMNHSDGYEDDDPVQKIRIGKRFVVHADISNCFGSIYSHALSWALVGKDKAKIERKGEWHNEIDSFTMNLNNGETHGILIGSHAFNIVSEIILTAVDSILSESYEYIRNIDDYSCYVRDFESAERFLIDLESELRKYGLTLNHKKTEILELPLTNQDWIRELTYFKSSNYYTYNDTFYFLDKAIMLMKENNNSAILNYAIKVLSDKKKSRRANEYFLNTVYHLVLLYPYLLFIIDDEVFSKIKNNNKKLDYIKRMSNDIYTLGLDKKNYEAAIYALYFSLKYDFLLKKDIFEDIEKTGDCILYLLAYLHDEKFINHNKVRKKYKSLAEDLYKNSFDEYWLFIYEVFTKGKFQNGDWKNMKSKGVSFIKKEFRVNP